MCYETHTHTHTHTRTHALFSAVTCAPVAVLPPCFTKNTDTHRYTSTADVSFRHLVHTATRADKHNAFFTPLSARIFGLDGKWECGVRSAENEEYDNFSADFSANLVRYTAPKTR